MITKDEEIGKLRTNVKHTNEALEEKGSEIVRIKADLDTAKEQLVTLEDSLETEKATALQEMSRGKSSALQTLQADLNAKHEADKKEWIEKHQQELSESLDAAKRDKQVS